MSRIPADYDRCQCEWLGGSFMTLGPRQMVRCVKPPTVIVTDAHDEERGSMSLCDEHLERLIEKFPNANGQFEVVNIATGIMENKL